MHKYEIIIYWSNEDGVYVKRPSFRDARPTATRKKLHLRASAKPWTCGLKQRESSATQSRNPRAIVLT